MAKESKADEATVEVKISELQAAKDKVITVMMNLQNYIGQITNAYMLHTNNIMAGGPATIEFPTLPPGLSSAVATDLAALGARPTSPGNADGTKKRKRAPVDPNAPKRALTPYFLFMQHNRHKIAADFPKDAKPKEISDEGTRRWQNLSEADKSVWKKMYAENYADYRKRVEEYKAGRKVEDDGAANQLQQENFAVADNEDDSSSSEDDNAGSEDESSPSPPQATPKEKTPASNKRRRSEPKAKEVPESVTKPTPAKKAKGGKKAAESVAATPAETKTKGGRKKRKSEA